MWCLYQPGTLSDAKLLKLSVALAHCADERDSHAFGSVQTSHTFSSRSTRSKTFLYLLPLPVSPAADLNLPKVVHACPVAGTNCRGSYQRTYTSAITALKEHTHTHGASGAQIYLADPTRLHSDIFSNLILRATGRADHQVVARAQHRRGSTHLPSFRLRRAGGAHRSGFTAGTLTFQARSSAAFSTCSVGPQRTRYQKGSPTLRSLVWKLGFKHTQDPKYFSSMLSHTRTYTHTCKREGPRIT